MGAGRRLGGASAISPGRKCSPGFPIGRFSYALRAPGANPGWVGSPSLLRGHWEQNLLNFLLGARSGLECRVGFSWRDSGNLAFHPKAFSTPQCGRASLLNTVRTSEYARGWVSLKPGEAFSLLATLSFCPASHPAPPHPLALLLCSLLSL